MRWSKDDTIKEEDNTDKRKSFSIGFDRLSTDSPRALNSCIYEYPGAISSANTTNWLIGLQTQEI